MGTVSDALDNAIAESFFAHPGMRAAGPLRLAHPPTLRTAVFHFIEVFYNRQRTHSTLDYQTPADYEHHHTSPAPAA
jgi:putative transposase